MNTIKQIDKEIDDKNLKQVLRKDYFRAIRDILLCVVRNNNVTERVLEVFTNVENSNPKWASTPAKDAVIEAKLKLQKVKGR